MQRDPSKSKKWVIFDGPIDSLWVENLNSLLDENRKLTINSIERIFMSEKTKIMFETDALGSVSPATVSRCGILYLQSSLISP